MYLETGLKLIKQNEILLRYALIGFTGACLDFFIFTALTKLLFLNYIVANLLSVSVGITNNYFLNARYNFKVSDRHFRRFIIFFSIGLIGMGLSVLLLFIFIELTGLPALVSKLLTVVIVPVLQFILNKSITFKKY